MTAEQIAAMSDAELNKACAEHVMGWTLQVIEHSTAFGQIAIGFYYNETGSFICNETSFSPATSLADAARCTEAMLAKGWVLQLVSYNGGYLCTLWRTTSRPVLGLDTETGETYHTNENQIDRCTAKAATEPRARAEAALLAAMKGGDQK